LSYSHTILDAPQPPGVLIPLRLLRHPLFKFPDPPLAEPTMPCKLVCTAPWPRQAGVSLNSDNLNHSIFVDSLVFKAVGF
jgi:hypothetical protein